MSHVNTPYKWKRISDGEIIYCETKNLKLRQPGCTIILKHSPTTIDPTKTFEPMPFRPKQFLLIGHAQHGKDTTAEIIQELYGYTFESSSIAAARIFLFDRLKDEFGYKTIEECYYDRVNHRKLWHDLICEFNKDDKAALAKEILKTSNMYVGMRSDAELNECKKQGLFDYIIGVYDYRKPDEHKGSFTLNFWEQCDFVISNSTDIAGLRRRVEKLAPIFH